MYAQTVQDDHQPEEVTRGTRLEGTANSKLQINTVKKHTREKFRVYEKLVPVVL